MVALFSAQVLLAGGLYARHSGKVPAAVIVRMLVDVGLVDLGNISQKVAARIYGVLPYSAHLPLEAGEFVLDLVKAHVCFCRHGAHHCDGLEADGAAPAVEIGHLFPDEIRCNLQHGGKGQGVELLHLPGAHHYVVCHFVSNQDVAVAVEDNAAGGVHGFINGGVAVRVFLEAGVENLQGEDSSQQQEYNDSQADKQSDMPVILLHYFLVSGARLGRQARERNRLAASDAKKRAVLNQNGRVAAPSAHTYNRMKTTRDRNVAAAALPKP